MLTKWLRHMYLEEPDIAKASLHGSLHSRRILLKKKKTQKRLLERKPTSYPKATVMKLENLVAESAEADKKD